MKKIISRVLAFAAVAIAAMCVLSGCKKDVTITLSPYNYAVNEQFSLFTGLTVHNDFGGTISMTDNAKWKFVVSDNVAANMEQSGSNFVKVTAPCSGTVYAIYDEKGLNIRTNTVPIVIK